MNGFSQLWRKLARSKRYRAEFVSAQLKRGVPFQIRTLMTQAGLSQEELASRAGLTQGAVSRAANPDYGNLTLNTIIRIAAGLDVAFIGKFVPFSELTRWFIDLSEGSVAVRSFDEEDRELNEKALALVGTGAEKEAQNDPVQIPSDQAEYARLLDRQKSRPQGQSDAVRAGAERAAIGWLG